MLDSALLLPSYTLDYGSGPGASLPWLGSVNVGTLAPGDSVDVVISATVDPSTQPGLLSNTATVSSSTEDPDESDNSSTADTTVDTQADLSIAKSAPVSATAGDPAGFDYTMTVTNDGPSDNTGGFDVTDTLDSGLTFEAGGSDPALLGRRPARDLHQHGRSRDGLPDDTDTFTIHVTLASDVDSGATLSNTAAVDSNGTADPNSGNNTSSTTSTDVDEDVALQVTKTFDSATVTAGGVGTSFTIDVTNNGVSDADNVSPDRHGRRAADRGRRHGRELRLPGRRLRAESITCTLGHLAAGATKSITVDYHVASTTNAAAGVSNSAAAASDEYTVGDRHRHRRHRRERRPLGREDVRLGDGHGRRRLEDVHHRRDEHRLLGCRQRLRHRRGRCTAARDGDQRRRLHLRRAEPVDLVHARQPRGGRDEDDHRHLRGRLQRRLRRGREQRLGDVR